MPPYFVDSVGNIYIEAPDRRGRSVTTYTFKNQPHSQAIKGNDPTDFRLAFLHELPRVLDREDHDPVYRGDVKLSASGGQIIPPLDSDEDDNDELESDRAVTSSPSARTRSPSLVPTEPASPASSAPAPPSTEVQSRSVSPLSALTVSSIQSCPASPTITDFDNGLTEEEAAVRKKAIITYDKRGRKLHAARLDAQRAAVSTSTKGKVRPRKKYPAATRRSVRIFTNSQQGAMGEFQPDGMKLVEVAELGVPFIAPLADELRPMVDLNNRIVGAYAGAPVGQKQLWLQLLTRASVSMRHLRRTGEFATTDGPDAFVRAGIDFGVRGTYPHQVVNGAANGRAVQSLVDSAEFKALAAYQNHLLERVAPCRYAYQALQMQRLATEEQVHAAFPGSVFTTAEFSFARPESAMVRNTYDHFGSFRALTILGDYGIDSAWFLYWCEEAGDRVAVYCPPGTTLLVPGSVVRYGFSALRRGEMRFVFQQFYNAAVGRWGREWVSFHRHYIRVQTALDMLSTLSELYV
ncbi:hypothetical protein B0H13DRAFT_2370886 [Mycena leptocephala]|nr:hypothetical protein B0H13DRAFT_2370886 [Mycena leptocephala]